MPEKIRPRTTDARNMPTIEIVVHPSIADLPQIEKLKQDFLAYKLLSYNYAEESGLPISEFLPTLSVEDQRTYPPDHEMFGKDKMFEGPSRAIREQLYHVHLFRPAQEKTRWHNENNELAQWYCVSDSALVYSHIEQDSEDTIFLLLRVLDPGAHDAYKEEGLVDKWAQLSQDFRHNLKR